MKFWISKNNEVSVRKQIVTQIQLGVATRDLLPGEKLPSTREMARRFSIHANTVSAAYRELAEDGSVEFRKGSGVFVVQPVTTSKDQKNIDRLLTEFVSVASSSGFSQADIEFAMDRWRSDKGLKKLILVESDPGLRSIIEEEIRESLGTSVSCITLDKYLSGEYDRTAILAAFFDEKEKMERCLGPEQTAVFINANSVPHTLIGSQRPDKTSLIAVVSGWAKFIFYARIYLLAARIDPDALVIRMTTETDWKTGLDAAAILICDFFTARHFPGDDRVRVFKLVSEESMQELKQALT